MVTVVQPVQLPGNGPFELPKIAGCPGLEIAQDPSLILIRLVGANGQEFLAPLSDMAIRRLRDHLVGLFGAHD
jgi:hypothetical protein